MSARDTDINIDFNVKYKSLEKAEEAVDDLIKKSSGKGLSKLEKSMDKVSNSSKTLDKAVGKAGTNIKTSFGSKALNAVKNLKNKFKETKNDADKLGKTKVDGLTGSIFKANAALDLLKAGFSKVGQVAKTAFSDAMDMEQTELALNALVGDAGKASTLFDMLNKKGASSVFSESDFLTGGKALLPLTKDLGDIEKGMNVMERLAMSNMEQGMEGATFSMREYLSGDYTSIVERFNLPRSMVKESLKGADTIEERMEALDKLLQGMGFTDDYVAQVNTSTGAVVDNIVSNIKMKFSKAAGGILKKLKDPLLKLQAWVDSGALDNIFGKLGDAAAWAVDKIIKAFTWLKDNGVFTAIGEIFTDIKNKLVDLWNWIQTSGILNGIANIFKWLVEHKDFVIAALAGITAGFVTLRIVGLIAMIPKIWAAVTATWAFTTALLANPITWIVIAIGLLVAAIVLLVLKWDWVKQKAQELWGKITEVFQGIWNKIKEVFQGIWSTISSVFTTIWNFMVSMATTLFNVITWPFRKAWEIISPIVYLIWNVIKTVFTIIWQFISLIGQFIWAVISSVWNAIWGVISGVMGWIWNKITTVWNAVWGVISTVANAIWGTISSVFTSVWNTVSSIFTGIWDTATSIWSSISGTISGFVDGIQNGITTAFNTVKDVVVSVWEGIKGAIKGGVNFVIKGINTFLGGLNELKIPDWVPGVGGKGFHINLIPEFAKGTKGLYNTPDTFIAGEQGPELIVGAKGRRVLNNEETNNTLAPTSAGTSTTNSNNTYNITINVQGGDNPKETAKSVREELEDLFASFNRRNPRVKEV